MKRLLPAPLLSAALFVLWLVLNRSASAGQLVLAVLLALLIPLLTRGLRPLPVRVRHPGTVLRLLGRVVADSVQSNLAVLRLLLVPRRRRHAPGFVPVPLRLSDPNALAVLAVIVCIAPGTTWAELSRDRSVLLLHALELDDPARLITHTQAYERLLLEIFE